MCSAASAYLQLLYATVLDITAPSVELERLEDKDDASPEKSSVLTVEEYMKVNQFKITYDPPKDGNCQFSAIAHELNRMRISEGETSSSVRRTVCEFLSSNGIPDSNQYVCHDNDGKRAPSWNKYLSTLSENGTFGDELTLQAVVRKYSVQILILSNLGINSTVLLSPTSHDTHRFESIDLDESLPLFVVGHSAEGHGDHYCCVEAANKEAFLQFLTKIRHTSSGCHENYKQVRALAVFKPL